MKKILLINQGSSKNVGDIILNNVLKSLLSDKYDVLNFPYTAQIGLNKNVAKMQKKQGQLIEIKKRLAKYEIFNFYFINKKIKQISNMINMSGFDYAIIGGGELLKSRHEFFIEFVAWILFLKKKKIKTVLFGISCDRKFTFIENTVLKNIFKYFYYINVRDIYTKEFLQHKYNVNITFSPDPGFLYREIFDKNNHIKNNTILISVFSYNELPKNTNYDSIEKYYLFWENLIISNYNHLYLLKGFANTDEDYLETVSFIKWFNKRNEINIIECNNIKIKQNYSKIIDEIAEANIVITGRMHAMIIALQYNTKVIPFVFKDKIRDFASTYLSNDTNLDFELYKYLIKDEIYKALL